MEAFLLSRVGRYREAAGRNGESAQAAERVQDVESVCQSGPSFFYLGAVAWK